MNMERHPDDNVWIASKIVASYFMDHMGDRRAQLFEFMATYCRRELAEADRAIRWLIKHGILERFKRPSADRYANANRYRPTSAGLKWILENGR